MDTTGSSGQYLPFEHVFGHNDGVRNEDFRSMSIGRPPGSFEDPARRARAWHWLCVVQTLARVGKARHLDRPGGPLSRGLVQNPRFDQIRQDGYDPRGICARANISLLDHVASKRRFKSTKPIYEHRFWKYLAAWEPPWPERSGWVAAQLRRYRIVRYTPEDDSNGVELGLLREPERDLDPWWWSNSLPPLNLDEERFANLDGLLLLLILCREAQDAAHLDRAERLQGALYRAATLFAEKHNYRDEVADTWKWLTGARMIAWHPHLEPTETELKTAEDDLVEGDRIFGPRIPMKRQRYKTGARSDRRWRRQVWARACCLHLDRGRRNPAFKYRDTNRAYEWLVAHRDEIRQHQARAMELILMDEPEGPTKSLPPLVMPKSLYNSRRRPFLTGEDGEVYGDTSPYDVIPVVPESP